MPRYPKHINVIFVKKNKYMEIQTTKIVVNFFLMSCFSICSVYAQDQIKNIEQDQKFEQLLNIKRKINSSLAINDRYKIQIFSGSSENAKKILSDFRTEFRNIDATIVFDTPNYKVWVGNYKKRIEAEKTLILTKNKHKSAFIIKPNK